METASYGTRAISYIIDIVILAIVGALLSAILGQTLGQLLQILVSLGYFVYFWSMNGGQTPGKLAMGLKVVKADGTAITPTDAILRWIGYLINSIPLLIGWFWPLFDSQGQTFADKIAKTYVVKA